MKNRTSKMLLGLLVAGMLISVVIADAPQKQDKTPTSPPTTKPTVEKPKPKPLRAIRVAVFDFDVIKSVEVNADAITDQINAMLATMPKVTIVNRDQIKKVADEHKIALTGLVDTSSAVKLGKFLNAQYIVVGRASKIGHTFYLVVKMVDVETTVQATVSAKGSVEDGFENVLERLGQPLKEEVRKLQRPVVKPVDVAFAALRKAAKPLAGKVILVAIDEVHIDRPLKDPAAQMAVANRLKSLGFEVVVPKDPKVGWKRALLASGKHAEKKVDYLLEGDGVSAFAARMHNLVSCRARVELRLIALPGRNITVSEKGVAARVDLVEALAAKAALEDAGVNACDAVILRLAKQINKAKLPKKTSPPAGKE